MFTNFGIPDIERRKRKRNLLIGQPQGSLSESIDATVFICFDLKLLFLVACLLILGILDGIPMRFKGYMDSLGVRDSNM